MKRFCVRLLITYLYFAGYVQAFSFSKDNLADEAAEVYKLTQTDEDQITELRTQVIKLQQAVTEITRSFSALELVAKHPSMMKHIVESPKMRVERDVHSQSPPSPTSYPSLSDYQQSQSDSSPAGPYVWPLISGQCFMCPAGTPGPRGPPGSQGITGRDGRDGRDAATQPQVEEIPGDPIAEPITDPIITADTGSSQSGAIYIRWGNKECPTGAELVYKGTVGGAHYSHAGSGANYLCMPDDPIYDEVETSSNLDRALLYSSEYQTSTTYSRLQPMHDHTPTCAVCKAPSGRTTKLMIPARNVCPSSEWHLEYAGYLMAERYTHKRSEFVCVDRALDIKAGTQGNQNGVLMYMVEGRCLTGGGLPCGPYIDGYELTCAVCTI